MVSDAQAGTLGEALFTAYCIWSTGGRLGACRPPFAVDPTRLGAVLLLAPR